MSRKATCQAIGDCCSANCSLTRRSFPLGFTDVLYSLPINEELTAFCDFQVIVLPGTEVVAQQFQVRSKVVLVADTDGMTKNIPSLIATNSERDSKHQCGP